MTKRELIISLFDTNKTIDLICKEVGTTYKTVVKYWLSVFSEDMLYDRKSSNYSRSKLGVLNPQKGLRGKVTANYKKGCWVRQGYIYIPAPSWYEGPKHAGYAREHVLVYCEYNEITYIPLKQDIHHLDFNKLNNDPKNLIMLSKRDHQLLHAWLDCKESVETISNESRPRAGRPKRKES